MAPAASPPAVAPSTASSAVRASRRPESLSLRLEPATHILAAHVLGPGEKLPAPQLEREPVVARRRRRLEAVGVELDATELHPHRVILLPDRGARRAAQLGERLANRSSSVLAVLRRPEEIRQPRAES